MPLFKKRTDVAKPLGCSLHEIICVGFVVDFIVCAQFPHSCFLQPALAHLRPHGEAQFAPLRGQIDRHVEDLEHCDRCNIQKIIITTRSTNIVNLINKNGTCIHLAVNTTELACINFKGGLQISVKTRCCSYSAVYYPISRHNSSLNESHARLMQERS